MKHKFSEFLKAFGAFAVILVVIVVGVLAAIGELFPAAVPEWVYIAVWIVSLPFWVAIFVNVIKEYKRERKDKKAQKEKIKKK